MILSGIALHVYTAVMAYQVADPGLGKYGAALAAFWFPVLAQGVVAVYAWQATGSKVNQYSVWILLWLLLAAVVALLALFERRQRSR